MPCLWRRALCLVTPRSHRITRARAGCRSRGSDAVQLYKDRLEARHKLKFRFITVQQRPPAANTPTSAAKIALTLYAQDRGGELAPAWAENLRRRRRGKAGRSWYVDETYIKVHGKWCYLYRAIDRSGALVDVMFSEHRDMEAAKAFFESAKMAPGVIPDRVTTDGHDSYPRAIRTALGAGVRHRDSQYLNNRLEQDHRGVKGRCGPMRGFQSPRSAGEFCRAYDELRNFLRSRSRTNQQVSADYRRLHFLRRTATVLSVLEAA